MKHSFAFFFFFWHEAFILIRYEAYFLDAKKLKNLAIVFVFFSI